MLNAIPSWIEISTMRIEKVSLYIHLNWFFIIKHQQCRIFATLIMHKFDLTSFFDRMCFNQKGIGNWFRMYHFYFRHVKPNKYYNAKQFSSLLLLENQYYTVIHVVMCYSECCEHFWKPIELTHFHGVCGTVWVSSKIFSNCSPFE